MKKLLFDKDKISEIAKHFFEMALLLIASVVVGVICGAVGGAFAKSISFVTELRAEHGWLVFLLPLGGLASVALYKLAKIEGIGTDRAIEAAKGNSETPVLLMPVIFAASVITHLFGGSAGKEGAALQLGSGAAELISKLIKADAKKHAALTVCGMAALFSSVFGTTAGACVFALEVAVIGKMNISAVFPSIVSSIAARFVSSAMGVLPEKFSVGPLPDFEVVVLLKIVGVSIIASVAAGVFCHMLHGGEKLFEKFLKNSFLRIFAGGCAVIILTLIFGTDYNGGGMFVIDRIFEEGIVRPEAFLLKIIFTVITVCSGFKGGEIVPSFFIGATLGAALSAVFGLPIGFCAAIGMTAFFGAVTNCQIAAAVISVELFGANGFVFFAVAAFASRICFAKTGLYNKQGSYDFLDELKFD